MDELYLQKFKEWWKCWTWTNSYHGWVKFESTTLDVENIRPYNNMFSKRKGEENIHSSVKGERPTSKTLTK